MAQMQISRAVSYNKINVFRCRACVDIAGVTGSIPVAPTIFFNELRVILTKGQITV